MTIRPRYRLAIFDFDGTLADTFPSFTSLVNLAADEFGFKRIEADEVEMLRRKDPMALMRHLQIPAWKLPMIAAHMRSLFASEAHRISLFEGTADCLRHLHERQLKISIVSSNSEATIRRVLGPTLVELIDDFGCGASLFGKPAKLKKLVRKSGMAEAESIYVGDEIRDARAAKAAKMAFGAVSWGYSPVDALQREGPREVFDDRGDLAWKLSGSRMVLSTVESAG